MKKYEKPRVYIERFELSQHIASCAWDMSNSKNVEECSAVGDPEWDLPALNAFLDGNEKCTYGPIEDYCYTNSGYAANIFNS